MGTRQYVGARYVPTFANPIQWDNQRIYEPLTMVTYLNNTYTSKKPVPQGVDINNKEYWALTGNYNAQVEQYRQETENIANKYEKRFERKWLFLGDSYEDTCKWVEKTTSFMGIASSDYYNIAQSGHGFYQSTWLNDIRNWCNSNPDKISEIGQIVVGGGLNDSTADNVATLGVNMEAFSNFCKNTFDGANVYIAYFGWRVESVSDPLSRTGYYRAKAIEQYSYAPLYGMNYLSGGECCLHNKNLMNEDGTHPNNDGGFYIACYLGNALKNGSWETVKVGGATVEGEGVTAYVTQTIHGSTLTTTLAVAVSGVNIQFTGGQGYELCTMNFELSNTASQTPVMVNVKKDNGEFETVLFDITFKNNKMILTPLNINASKNGYENFNVTEILSFAYTMTNNAMLD